MANKNKSGNPLRILWIPGRKKHHDKGRYNATNKSPQQNHHQKPNEMWALGGSKGHESIIKSQSDSVEESTSNMVSSMVPSALGVTSVLGTKLSEEDENEENRKTAAAEVNEINSIQKKNNDKENEIHSLDDITFIDSTEYESNSNNNDNNTKTLLIRDRKNGAIKKTDVDSIEKLDEVDAESIDMPQEKLKTNDDGYRTIIYNRNRNGSRRKNKYKLNDEKDNKKKDKDSDSEEESKIVKCLYYGLVCCECSIS